MFNLYFGLINHANSPCKEMLIKSISLLKNKIDFKIDFNVLIIPCAGTFDVNGFLWKTSFCF